MNNIIISDIFVFQILEIHMKIDKDNSEPLLLSVSNKKKVKRKSILYRYSFFVFMNLCMILAFFTSSFGGSKGWSLKFHYILSLHFYCYYL
jgi:hypothetical protein